MNNQKQPICLTQKIHSSFQVELKDRTHTQGYWNLSSKRTEVFLYGGFNFGGCAVLSSRIRGILLIKLRWFCSFFFGGGGVRCRGDFFLKGGFVLGQTVVRVLPWGGLQGFWHFHIGRTQVRYQHEAFSHISCQTMFLFYMILGVWNGEGIQPILRNCQARMRVLSKNLGLWESARMNTSLSYILTETLMALKGELRACLGIPNGLGIVTLGNKRCRWKTIPIWLLVYDGFNLMFSLNIVFFFFFFNLKIYHL